MAEKKIKPGAKAERPADPVAAPKFSKGQLLGFQRYRGRGDLLRVLLDEQKKYTAAEADAAIERFMGSAVAAGPDRPRGTGANPHPAAPGAPFIRGPLQGTGAARCDDEKGMVN